MLNSGPDPESYITEYTLVYEDCGNAGLLASLSMTMGGFGLVVEQSPESGVGRSDNRPAFCYKAREVCEDQVLDGPASGEKGSKGGNSLSTVFRKVEKSEITRRDALFCSSEGHESGDLSRFERGAFLFDRSKSHGIRTQLSDRPH